ncbi:hypothetical protein UACE39S_00039 [Ureibacillus acetophenoni]
MIPSLKNEIVKIEITGRKFLNGALIDSSSEVVVIFDGKKFVYVPFEHIQTLEKDFDNEDNIQQPTETPSIDSKINNNDMTIAKILSQAKGMDVEIYVTSNKSLHGRISAIMDDYFVFQSHIYQTIFISNNHLKWLIPYSEQQLPYGLTKEELLIQTNNQQPYPSNFYLQIEQLKNKLVVINFGEKYTQIGKIKNVNRKLVELVLADSKSVYVNTPHIKTISSV